MMLSLILVFNGKQTPFEASPTWTVAELRDRIQKTLSMDSCKIVGLPKIPLDRSESNTTLETLKLKQNLKLICIGQVMTQEQKDLMNATILQVNQDKEYHNYITPYLQLFDNDIMERQRSYEQAVQRTQFKNSHDFQFLEWRQFIHECSLGNYEKATMISRNCSHQFDLFNIQRAEEAFQVSAQYGNSLPLVKYILEDWHLKPEDKVQTQKNKDILKERYLRDLRRVESLKQEGKVEESEKQLKILQEREFKEKQFDSAQEKIYRYRYEPHDVMLTLFKSEIIEFGRLDILKYLKDQWFPKYFIPEWNTWTDFKKLRYYSNFRISLVPIRQKQGDLEMSEEEKSDLSLQINRQIIEDPQYIWVNIFQYVLRHTHSFRYGGDRKMIYYCLNFLKQYNALSPVILQTLTRNAIEQCNNHFIYMDLLNNWKPHYRQPPTEMEYEDYLRKNVKECDAFKKNILTLNCIYDNTIVYLLEKKRDHWIEPEALLDMKASGSPPLFLDWTLDKYPELFNLTLIEKMLGSIDSHSHTRFSLSPSVLYLLQKYHKKLVKTDLILSLRRFFAFDEEKNQLSRFCLEQCPNLILWAFRNSYFFLDSEMFQKYPAKIQFFFMAIWSLLEKKELLADHSAKFLSGRVDSLKQLRQSIHQGEVEYVGNDDIQYTKDTIVFHSEFSRMITFYMNGTQGSKYQHYVLEGMSIFGPEWRKVFAEMVEERRVLKLAQIQRSEEENKKQAQQRLDEEKDAWLKMLMDQLQKSSTSSDNHSQEVKKCLLQKQKLDVLRLTSSNDLTKMDFDDVHILLTLL